MKNLIFFLFQFYIGIGGGYNLRYDGPKWYHFGEKFLHQSIIILYDYKENFKVGVNFDSGTHEDWVIYKIKNNHVFLSPFRVNEKHFCFSLFLKVYSTKYVNLNQGIGIGIMNWKWQEMEEEGEGWLLKNKFHTGFTSTFSSIFLLETRVKEKINLNFLFSPSLYFNFPKKYICRTPIPIFLKTSLFIVFICK